ncbi:MAG: hypothetical protein EU536_03265 [Promethearchaeota archaeon]|nr:MAG: hypothetical protein EU536_03265 [Candidatus Lokiarchaeota archaeon]
MSDMIDEKIEKEIQQFLDQELEKRLKHVQLDLLKEVFLTRDEFKKEMERIQERFDAMQAQMDKRFDAMQAQMDKRFDAMQAQMDKRFEQMDKRFDAMQAQMDKRFDAMQAQMDKRFENVYKRFDAIALDFGTAIEKIGYAFIKDSLEAQGISTFPRLRAHFIDQDHEVHAGTTDVEVDLFSADIPLIGECTLKITDMAKLDIFLRKINFIEKRYQKKFKRVVFTLNISPTIQANVERFCQQWDIKLISS